MEILSLPNFFEFAVLCLASFRISRFFVEDYFFASVRNRIFDRFPPESTKTGYLFTCMWCLGFWVSLLVFFCYTIVSIQTLWICFPLAISSVVGLLSALEHRF